jgi:hypothetical protein
MEGISPEALEARVVALELTIEKMNSTLTEQANAAMKLFEELSKKHELTKEEAILEALNDKATREELDNRFNEASQRIKDIENLAGITRN